MNRLASISNRFKRRGFVLFECMLAAFIFGAGAIALAKCMENCIKAERFRREEGLAQRALSNYWVQIENGAIPLSTDKVSEELKPPFEGMTMVITRTPLELTNEKEVQLFGLYQVTLDLNWKSPMGELITRSLSFTIYPRQQ